MTAEHDFILASASPRRAALLRGLGLRFAVSAQHIDESRAENEPATEFVIRLALEKAGAAAVHTDFPVLGSDTIVVVDDQALGKPENEADAIRMLSMLSGREHEVMTAVAVVQGDKQLSKLSRTRVRVRDISRDEMHAYWQTGEPQDKAGSYAIQGLAAVFVSEIQGSYSGVVGLPLFETAELLAQFGIRVMSDAAR